jgi:hypothetical protein
VPIKNKDNMKQPMTLHIAYTNSNYFLFCSLSQPLAFNTILTNGKIKLHFFAILLNYLTYTTSFYFTMARRKLPPIFTPNTLESMIEYTLIPNILNRICEMTTKPWECQRNDTWLFPL